jgi:putative addiction module component (TIGR02574 family)
VADAQITEYIDRLTAPERLALIGQLWDSLESEVPVTAAHKEELDRRLDMLTGDPASVMSWGALRAELESDCD